MHSLENEDRHQCGVCSETEGLSTSVPVILGPRLARRKDEPRKHWDCMEICKNVCAEDLKFYALHICLCMKCFDSAEVIYLDFRLSLRCIDAY